MRLVAVPLIGLLVFISSCGDDEGAGPGMTAGDHNAAGWSSYAGEDYASARASFEQALGIDIGLTEARLGLAWCKAHEGEYSAAFSDFDVVREAEQYVADAFAGSAATALGASQDPLAIAHAESTLARSPAYEFGRRPSYNWRDLRLILAQGNYSLAQYGDAQAQVDILDPDNGLDPADSESWVVDGQAHLTYEAALAMEIELLWSTEGGWKTVK
jgi:hypothetical protein